MDEIFGDWIKTDTNKLLERFVTARPFKHVVIPGFFREEVARAILKEFPTPGTPGWYKYDNPIERKYALNDFTGLDVIKDVFAELQKEYFVEVMRRSTDIHDLITDPHLHGAGIHAYPRGGKLDMHLDYSIHPISGMERRVNLIVYLNDDWYADEYGGHLHMTSELYATPKKIAPDWNTAILFCTCDNSYHGIPEQITCPEGMYRKSLAIYYVSPPRPDACFLRKKAEFFPPSCKPVSEGLRRLYEIRKERLITEMDLSEVNL
jgi:Rps23 Pro-64 3,4-dihydroxylase Tpa1-like proline 4-hydroxylase